MNRTTLVRRSLYGAGFLAAMTLCCTSDRVAGTGTETSTKGIVMGALYAGSGAASHTAVIVVPQSYNPLVDGPINDANKDTTDANGNYSVGPIDTGLYNIEAARDLDGTKLFMDNVVVGLGDNKRAADTLGRPGSMIVTLPMPVTSGGGALYFSGSTISVPVSPANAVGNQVRIDSLPPGQLSSLYYTASSNAVDPVKIADSVRIAPDRATPVVAYSALWKFSRKVYLNTTASGARIYAKVYHFPVLVRLTNLNFTFGNAKGNGEDVRFVTSGGAPMPYQIDRWDPAQQRAEVWVSVDTVYPNDSSRYFVMYWGNTGAQSVADGAKVFDTANGFQAVWHLNQTGTDSVLDATANRFNGVSQGATWASPVAGEIGAGRRFDGWSSFVVIPNSAAGALNFPGGGHFTLSAWVYADSLDNGFHQILSKGDRQYGFQLHNINQWEIFDFTNAAGWQSVRSPATAGTWKYVVGVRDGANEMLYVDGQLTSNGIISRDSTGRDTSLNVYIGKQAASPWRYWKGILDEVCASSTARSWDWIFLSYMNQKEYNTLIVFK